jgi:hypothetical protein
MSEPRILVRNMTDNLSDMGMLRRLKVMTATEPALLLSRIFAVRLFSFVQRELFA